MLNHHAASMRQAATNIRKSLLARQAYIPLIAVYAILGTAWAAAHILLRDTLKFMPIVVLAFLACDGRRFHFRLVGCCVAFVVLGFLASVLVWGTSTFVPVAFAATGRPFLSIYFVMNSQHSPLSSAAY